MEVILKEDVNKLGSRGDVKVAEATAVISYCRGKLAIEASKATRRLSSR